MTEHATMDEKGSLGRIRIRTPAKINLILRVLDRRKDGFHNLWSLMQTVTLEDELDIEARTDSQQIRLECSDTSLPVDQRNLVSRAASRVLEQSRSSVGLNISVTKRIPVGAGLGGGSSDAAATIFALNHLLRLRWAPEEMARLSQTLGSDVPFFFFAPSAVVCGKGEEVTRIHLAGQRWVVLVQPAFAVETKWAYERLTNTRKGVRPLSKAIEAIAAKGSATWDEIIPHMENDFEEALPPSHGTLRELKHELLSQGAEAALLSGSGSTVFGLFRTEGDAGKAAALGRWQGHRTAVVAASTTALTCCESSSSVSLSTS